MKNGRIIEPYEIWYCQQGKLHRVTLEIPLAIVVKLLLGPQGVCAVFYVLHLQPTVPNKIRVCNLL